MNDERKMILTMLAEGKVSAEEANLLLEALATSEAKTYVDTKISGVEFVLGVKNVDIHPLI